MPSRILPKNKIPNFISYFYSKTGRFKGIIYSERIWSNVRKAHNGSETMLTSTKLVDGFKVFDKYEDCVKNKNAIAFFKTQCEALTFAKGKPVREGRYRMTVYSSNDGVIKYTLDKEDVEVYENLQTAKRHKIMKDIEQYIGQTYCEFSTDTDNDGNITEDWYKKKVSRRYGTEFYTILGFGRFNGACGHTQVIVRKYRITSSDYGVSIWQSIVDRSPEWVMYHITNGAVDWDTVLKYAEKRNIEQMTDHIETCKDSFINAFKDLKNAKSNFETHEDLSKYKDVAPSTVTWYKANGELLNTEGDTTE